MHHAILISHRAIFAARLIPMLYTAVYTAVLLFVYIIVYRLATGHDVFTHGTLIATHIALLSIIGTVVLETIPSRFRKYRQFHEEICRVKAEVKLCHSDIPPPTAALSV